MICVVVKGPTIQQAHQQISKAMRFAELIELRLDEFQELDLAALRQLRSDFSIPMIFTLRSRTQGGKYNQSEKQRIADIERLLTLKPEYFDFEHDVEPAFIEKVASVFPDTSVILSYHDFEKTPEDLEGIYRKMQRIPASFYKVAVTARNGVDALRLLCWAKNNDNGKRIAISMGVRGQITRILSPIIGCPITYAALEPDLSSAPGQVTAKTLIERYHYSSLGPRTRIYGLIGDPVDRSISDITHNCVFQGIEQDAVYVKIQIDPSETSDFLQLAKQLPFHGLSVTMPLKERVLPFLDVIDPDAKDIGAVNTIVFKDRKIHGFNTDGIGALNALERTLGPVRNRRLGIIGLGGAGKAIAREACRRGALVTIMSRDAGKARQFAKRLDCYGDGLDYMPTYAKTGYDVIINCTPNPQPISSETILANSVVMDLTTSPKETDFLKQAKCKGCRIVYGYRMFVEQALEQFRHWFKDVIDIERARGIVETTSHDCLRNDRPS